MTILKENIEEYKDSLGPLEQYIPGLDKIISGNEYHGRCPFCNELGDPNSPCFWVWAESQRYICRKCDAKGDIITYIEEKEGRSLAEQLREAGLLDDEEDDQSLAGAKKKNADQEKKDSRTAEEKKFDFIWSQGKDSGIPYTKYLEPARGIKLQQRSPAIRFNSYKGKDGARVNVILMALTRPGDSLKKPQSIMRVFLKKEREFFIKDSGMALNRKKMAQTGRAVWFFPDMDKKVVGHGEGQETMLAVHAATGMNVAASLTTSGINNIAFFPEQEKVFFFVDQDQPRWSRENGKQTGCQGQSKVLKAALRAQKKGLDAWVVTPTEDTFTGDPDRLGKLDKVDFNDLLKNDQTGESIRARVEAAVRPEVIKWTEPPDKKVVGGLLDEDGNLLPQNYAAMFLAQCSKDKFASSVVNVWYQFNGASWEPCEKGEFHEHVVAVMDKEAGATGYSINYMSGAVKLLQYSGKIRLSEENQNKVPFENGMLDLKTKEFITTTPDNAMRWHLPFNYGNKTDCPFFIKWLNDVCDDPTGDTQWFVRAIFNTCLVERDDLQYFVHFKGLPGTGKGTIIKIMEAVVGEKNKVSSDFKTLAKSQFETRRFYNKRLLIFNEVPKHIDIQTFLNLTGRDGIRYERKGKNDDLTFVFKGLIALTSNEFFTTNDQTSTAIERRRRTIVFNRVFTEQEKKRWSEDGGFEQLQAEIPEIVKWALEMTRAEVSDAFHSPPRKVQEANQRAEKANSPLVDFIHSNVVYVENGFVHIGVNKPIMEDGERYYHGENVRLYPRYLSWCSQEGKRRPLAKSVFIEAALNYINLKIVPEGKPDVYHVKGKKKYGGYPIMNIELIPVTDDGDCMPQNKGISSSSYQDNGAEGEYNEWKNKF